MNGRKEQFHEFLKRNKPYIDGKTYNYKAMQVVKGHLEMTTGGQFFTRTVLPLDYYLSRNAIDQDRHSVGLRFLKDHAIAFVNKSILERLLEAGPSFSAADTRMAAADRYMRIKAALCPTSWWLADLVIIQGYMLADIHYRMGWAKANTGLDRFKEMLDEMTGLYIRMEGGENILEKNISEDDKKFLHQLRAEYTISPIIQQVSKE